MRRTKYVVVCDFCNREMQNLRDSRENIRFKGKDYCKDCFKKEDV